MKKMFNILFIVLLAGTHFQIMAQTFQWANRAGSAGIEESAYSTDIDASGNIYTVGRFNDTTDFDPGPGIYHLIPSGANDIFVSKSDASGNFIWAKKMGGPAMDQGYSISLDAAGNSYITGYFELTADFDPGPGVYNLTSVGSMDIFVAKLDTAGNFEWAVSMGASGIDKGYSVSADAAGNVYATGYFVGTVDFDPSAGTYNLTAADYDGFISKLDPSGNLLWAKQINSNSYLYSFSVDIDGAGNVYTTGSFAGTGDFDPGAGVFNLTSSGNISMDIFILKLNAAGNFIWAKKMDGNGTDHGRSIHCDAFGNVYTSGNFSGSVDFDPGAGSFLLTSAAAYDIFISKLDSAGNFIWAKKIGGNGNDFGWSISSDAAGNVYTTGEFRGVVDFDPGLATHNMVSAGNADIFISKIDSAGNYVWAKKIGSSGYDFAWNINVDGSSNIYICGSFLGTVDFNPDAGIDNLTSAGNDDMFVLKYGFPQSFCGSDIIISNSPYNVYLTESKTWIITSGTVLIPVGTYVKLDADANQYVALNPGFNAEYGSVFVAQAYNGCTVGAPLLPQFEKVFNGEISAAADEIVLYPNPTTGLIHIKHDEKLSGIQIFDMMGKLAIDQKCAGETETNIDLSYLPNGVYHVKAAGYNAVKVVKNN